MKNARKILSLWLILFSITQFVRQDFLAQTADAELSASVNFKADEKVLPTAALEITLSRNLTENEKIAVTFDKTDVTSLFKQAENRFVYDAKLLPVPVGDNNLTVYLIADNNAWQEILKSSFSVEEQKSVEKKKPELTASADILTPTEKQTGSETNAEMKTEDSGTKTETPAQETETEAQSPKPEARKPRLFNFLPTFTIAMKSQPAQTNFPAENRPETRATFNDFTLTGSLKNETRIGVFSSDSNFDFAGSSFKEETLQFSAKGRAAPDVDLASYLVNFQFGRAKFAWGHTSFGENRHLVSSFSSRGLSFQMPINKRFDIKAGVLNGTSLVGFGNFSGLGKIRHQVQGATLGIELLPKRQNAARLEITVFNGYLQALNGVSEGRLTDAERSRGFGLKFITADESERFKLEFGYSLSRFLNPQDTTLDPAGNAVALPAVLRSASYAEISYQILKDVKLTETKNVNLNFAFKFEIAEPLYKSLGASASADRFSHDYIFEGSVGEINFQFAHGRFNDNLRNIPSILKSLTRGKRFSLALPFSALLPPGKREKPSPFLPRLGFSFDRTHQFGAGIPVSGGFEIDLSTIPDLFNTNQHFSSAWQFEKFNIGYTYNRTFADNRQKDFEKNDQLGSAHAVTVGVNPLEILSFSAGLNFDTSRNPEILQTNRTKTLTFGANFQPFKGATVSSNFSNTLAGDAANIVNNRNANFDAQFAYNFSIEKSKFKKFGMQLFMRFADTYARSRDASFEQNNRTRTKIVNAGLTFNFF